MHGPVIRLNVRGCNHHDGIPRINGLYMQGSSILHPEYPYKGSIFDKPGCDSRYCCKLVTPIINVSQQQNYLSYVSPESRI